MVLYTRHGDQGETGLWGGERISKASIRIDAIGSIDELNASIGLCVSFLEWSEPKARTGVGDLKRLLVRCQNNLFSVGAELAKVAGGEPISPSEIDHLEREIDRLVDLSPRLTKFILPGGTTVAAMLHVTRTVARRAERAVVKLSQSEDAMVRTEIVQYLNRLSDMFFAAARAVNSAQGGKEHYWESGSLHHAND